jgi:hypothetical protein
MPISDFDCHYIIGPGHFEISASASGIPRLNEDDVTHDFNSVAHDDFLVNRSGPAKWIRNSLISAILDALQESRLRQARRIIRDHDHLLAKPIAELMKSCGKDEINVKR